MPEQRRRPQRHDGTRGSTSSSHCLVQLEWRRFTLPVGFFRYSRFAVLEAKAMRGFEAKMRSVPEGHLRERILVAEDDLVSAERMQELLELEGFEVAIATNAAGALREAHAFEPKTILLDVQLGNPGLDGIEVCRRLKASGTGARIVALTGNLAKDEHEVRKLGFDAIVYRPVRADVLMDRLAAASKPRLSQWSERR
jgi:CheY-like chemotaxis protein